MQDDAYEEFECDEGPTRSPEEIEDAYKKLKEDDDSVKTHQNPRYKDAKFIAFKHLSSKYPLGSDLGLKLTSSMRGSI